MATRPSTRRTARRTRSATGPIRTTLSPGTLRSNQPGSYQVAVTYSCQPSAEGSRFTVEVADQKILGTSQPTQSWSTYRTEVIGTITLNKRGYALAVKPSPDPVWKVIGLKSVDLRPVGMSAVDYSKPAPAAPR